VAKAEKVVKGPPALVPKPAPSRPVLSEVVVRRQPRVASAAAARTVAGSSRVVKV